MEADVDWEAFVTAQARLLGLELDPARRTEVAMQLSRIATMVQPLLEFDEDRHCEPAPVFRP